MAVHLSPVLGSLDDGEATEAAGVWVGVSGEGGLGPPRAIKRSRSWRRSLKSMRIKSPPGGRNSWSGLAGGSSRAKPEPVEDVERLYAQIGRLQMEVEWLKKSYPVRVTLG